MLLVFTYIFLRTISTNTQNASIWSLTAAVPSDNVFRVLCTNWLTLLLTYLLIIIISSSSSSSSITDLLFLNLTQAYWLLLTDRETDSMKIIAVQLAECDWVNAIERHSATVERRCLADQFRNESVDSVRRLVMLQPDGSQHLPSDDKSGEHMGPALVEPTERHPNNNVARAAEKRVLTDFRCNKSSAAAAAPSNLVVIEERRRRSGTRRLRRSAGDRMRSICFHDEMGIETNLSLGWGFSTGCTGLGRFWKSGRY